MEALPLVIDALPYLVAAFAVIIILLIYEVSPHRCLAWQQ